MGGGAVASLFAFCANRELMDGNADAPFFTGLPDISLVTFGAPAVVKNEELYSGKPGHCFDGVRMAIGSSPVSRTTKSFTVDAISHTKVLLGTMQSSRSAELVASLTSEMDILEAIDEIDTETLDEFKSRFVMTYMTDVIKETTNFLIQFALGNLRVSRLIPLLQTVRWLSPNLNDPSEELSFEFDVTPALLQDLGFRHANVKYTELGHPRGARTPSSVGDLSSCASVTNTKAPGSEFMQVFWATLGSFAMPKIKEKLRGAAPPTPFPPNKDYSAGFPNHHLCCYLMSLTNDTDAECGANPETLVPYTCEAPVWR